MTRACLALCFGMQSFLHSIFCSFSTLLCSFRLAVAAALSGARSLSSFFPSSRSKLFFHFVLVFCCPCLCATSTAVSATHCLIAPRQCAAHGAPTATHAPAAQQGQAPSRKGGEQTEAQAFVLGAGCCGVRLVTGDWLLLQRRDKTRQDSTAQRSREEAGRQRGWQRWSVC